MARTEAVVKMSGVRGWLAVCLIMLTAGCSVPAEKPGAAALKPLDPKAFQAVVDAAATELGVPGAVVLLRTPNGTVTAVTGTTELGTKTPPSADTHFRIASQTKTMTSALIVLLAQDGKLKFSDPVSMYVPNVPNGQNITVADLLRMRSGLYGYTADPGLAAAMDAEPSKSLDAAGGLDIAFRQPPLFAPDAAYDYSNTNYALLGLIAEKVGGRPLAEQLRGCGCSTRSGWSRRRCPPPTTRRMPYALFARLHVRRQHLRTRRRSVSRRRCRPPHEPEPFDPSTTPTRTRPTPPPPAARSPPPPTSPPGCRHWSRARSSMPTSEQWLTSLQAEDPDVPDGQKYGYGITYQRFGPDAAMFYHGGELPGFNSFMGYDPDHDVTLVIWTNLTLSPDGRTTANAMLPAILDEIYPGLSLR